VKALVYNPPDIAHRVKLGSARGDTRTTEKHYAHLAQSYVADTIRARFPTRDESFYETEFRTVDAVKKAKLIGREQFRRPSTVVDILLRSHAELPDDDKEAVRLVRAAVRDRSSRTYRLTNRTGWYGDSFVYLTETFGDLAGKLRHVRRSRRPIARAKLMW
jgi:hypothetical protein